MRKDYVVFLIMVFGLLVSCSSENDAVPKNTEKSSSKMELKESRMNDLQNKTNSPYIGTMIVVPEGCFQRNEQLENSSSVASFYMSQTEVTRQQFTDVTGLDDPSAFFEDDGNHPVQNILWYHTLFFCNQLSLKEELTPVYSVDGSIHPVDWGRIPATNDEKWNNVIVDWEADGYRLPTEMEWLWAAMGADSAQKSEINTRGYQKRFAGDNGVELMEDYVWYQSNSNASTHSVAEKAANELGFFDMTGNVW